jgi:hypothetical protein
MSELTKIRKRVIVTNKFKQLKVLIINIETGNAQHSNFRSDEYLAITKYHLEIFKRELKRLEESNE